MKMYQKIAQLLDWRKNCEEENNFKWYDISDSIIQHIMRNEFPHGSGIDGETTINTAKTNNNRLVFEASYHVINENGYYTHWIDYNIIVIPSLQHNFDLRISGNFGKCQDIKDYLHEVYDCFFNQDFSKEKYNNLLEMYK